MPVQPPAVFLGLVLDLVVPDAQLLGAAQLGGHVQDRLIVDQGVEGRAGLPDVHDLPDGVGRLGAQVAQQHRLRNGGVIAVVDDAHHFALQRFNGCIVQERRPR